jgi:methyl-accepting chemotaxis protein
MNSLRVLTIQKKLLFGFALLLVFLGALGFVAWRNTATFSEEFSLLYHQELQGSLNLADAERALWELRFGLPSYILGDAAGREAIRTSTARWVAQLDDNVRAYRTTRAAGSGAAKALLDEFSTAYATYLRARPQFFALIDAGKTEEATQYRARETNPPAAKAVATLAKLNALQQKIAAEREAGVSRLGTTSGWIVGVLIVAALGAGFTLTVATSRSIVRPLVDLTKALQELARGDADLTQRLDDTRADELGLMGRAFNEFLGKLNGIVGQVKAAAAGTGAAASQLSSSTGQLSSGAQEQAASLEETAASLEEIASTVKQTADSAQQADRLAAQSRQTAERGGEVVRTAVAAMSEITTASTRIAAITASIDEIAFQTNLLALNAAVEAARAGEQGRGFAVVAAEVRALAQRAATAAKEIKALIGDSVSKVAAGSDAVARSGQTLDEIVGSVKRVTDLIAEIAAASRQQTHGLEQVNRAVAQMDQVVQGNAAQTEELSSTAETLATQAADLEGLVGKFRLSEERGTTERRPRPVVATPPAHALPAAAPSLSRHAATPHADRRAAAGDRRAAAPARRIVSERRATEPAPSLVVHAAANARSHHDGFEEF